MNSFAIGAQPYAGGFLAWFRKVHRCDNEILKDERGQQIIYSTKEEAKAAAGEALCGYINGNIVGGELAGPSIRDVRRAQAEKVFGKSGRAA